MTLTDISTNFLETQDGQREAWWDADKGKAFNLIAPTVKAIEENQRYRERMYLAHARLYGNTEIVGMTGSRYARPKTTQKLTLNLCRSITDTIRSKIGKNKPRAMFLTDDGDWTMQRKARQLTKFVGGLFYGSKIYRLGPKAITDACALGTGVLKIYEDEGTQSVRCERAFVGELFVDDEEAINGDPRQLHQRKTVARETLVRAFCYVDGKLTKPELKKKIMNAPRTRGETSTHRRIANMVDVTESWHLPSGSDAKDGRHVISLESADLRDEVWEKDYFPFVALRWAEPLRGWYGDSLIGEVVGLQLEVNKILGKIQKYVNGIAPHIALQRNSSINNAHISNEVWSIIEYDTTPPTPITFAGLPPELLGLLQFYVQSAYQISGVSMLSAQSQKPQGLNSGKALREFNDIESERFYDFGAAYEQFFIDAAEMMIDFARDIYTRDGEFKVRSVGGPRGSRFVEEIDWKDIDLKGDQYVMQVFPTNFLPSTPAGKLQTIQEFLDVFPEMRPYALSLLDFPDIASFTNLVNSSVEITQQGIEDMSEGKPFEPDPRLNLKLAQQMVVDAYFRFKAQKLPDTRLALFEQAISALDGMLNPPAPVAAPPGAEAAPPAGPEGMPPPGTPPPEGAAPPAPEQAAPMAA